MVDRIVDQNRGLEAAVEVSPNGGVPSPIWSPTEAQRLMLEDLSSAWAIPEGQLPILVTLVPILVKALKMKPKELLANPEMRIVEDREDPEVDTLGASSLQSLKAKGAVEQTFGFVVPENEQSDLRSLRRIVERIAREQTAREEARVQQELAAIGNDGQPA